MDHSLRTLLYTLTLAALVTTALEAAPLALSNTGVDANNDSIDDNYTITRMPDGSTGNFAAYLNFAVIHPGPADTWSANTATSTWIGPAVEQDDSELPIGIYYYTTWFTLSGSSIPDLTVEGNWGADGIGNDILVNGRSTGASTGIGSYVTSVPFQIGQNSCSGGCFQDGLNELTFVVNNGGIETGLRVEAGISYGETATPEPGTYALIGGGLAALGLVNRRTQRRQA